MIAQRREDLADIYSLMETTTTARAIVAIARRASPTGIIRTQALRGHAGACPPTR